MAAFFRHFFTRYLKNFITDNDLFFCGEARLRRPINHPGKWFLREPLEKIRENPHPGSVANILRFMRWQCVNEQE